MRFSDLSGLVTWSGTYTQFEAGLFVDNYVLSTECINGKKGSVSVTAWGGAPSIGLPISMVGGSISFETPGLTPDPEAFEGFYYRAGGVYGIGFGFAAGYVHSGSAISKPTRNNWTYNIPPYINGVVIGVGASIAIGHAYIKYPKVVECDSCGTN